MKAYVKKADSGIKKMALISFLGSIIVPTTGVVVGGTSVIANYVYNTTSVDSLGC